MVLSVSDNWTTFSCFHYTLWVTNVQNKHICDEIYILFNLMYQTILLKRDFRAGSIATRYNRTYYLLWRMVVGLNKVSNSLRQDHGSTTMSHDDARDKRLLQYDFYLVLSISRRLRTFSVIRHIFIGNKFHHLRTVEPDMYWITWKILSCCLCTFNFTVHDDTRACYICMHTTFAAI